MLREIHALLPFERLHYVADSAYCPYGRRTFEEIRARTSALTERLMVLGALTIVIACNSATIAAIESLRTTYPIPFVGMEPAVKPAAQTTRSGVVGVLATEMSLAGEKYHRLVDAHAHGVRVITRPCPEFVDLVEAGILSGPKAQEVVEMHVNPLLEEGADVLVLGCSHFPFLRSVIELVAGPHVAVLETGSPVSRRLKTVLEAEGLQSSSQEKAEVIVQTTGDLELLQTLMPTLCPGLPASLSKFEFS